MSTRIRRCGMLTLAILGLACDSTTPAPRERVSLLGTWSMTIDYHKPSAECHFVRPSLEVVSETYGHAAAGFDADSLICQSTVVGKLVTTPDHAGAPGFYSEDEFSFLIGVEPLITEQLVICGRAVTRDSLEGGLCPDHADYGDTITGAWHASRVGP